MSSCVAMIDKGFSHRLLAMQLSKKGSLITAANKKIDFSQSTIKLKKLQREFAEKRLAQQECGNDHVKTAESIILRI